MNKQQLKAILRQLKTSELWEFYIWKFGKISEFRLEFLEERKSFYLNNRELLLRKIIENFYVYLKEHQFSDDPIFTYAGWLIKKEVEEFVKLKGNN